MLQAERAFSLPERREFSSSLEEGMKIELLKLVHDVMLSGKKRERQKMLRLLGKWIDAEKRTEPFFKRRTIRVAMEDLHERSFAK